MILPEHRDAIWKGWQMPPKKRRGKGDPKKRKTTTTPAATADTGAVNQNTANKEDR